MTIANIQPLWAIEDVSQYLGVPVKTLYQWRGRNYGPPGKRVGRHIRYRPEDVVSWLDAIGA